MCMSCVVRLIAPGLILIVLASGLAGQSSQVPTISARQFSSGSAQVRVTGAERIDEEVTINAQASVGAGDMTWIQFGVSGAETPNALITYQPGELGISVSRGRFIATAGIMVGAAPQCSGSTEVTATSVSGHYTCAKVTSYDAGTGKMGEIDVEIRFTAKS